MIIDAHHHLFKYAPGRMPWIGETSEFNALKRDFQGREFAPLLHDNGIDGTVIIQAAHTIEDTETMVAAASKHSFIKGIVAWAPLDDPIQMDRHLDAFKAEPLIKGIRHMLMFEDDRDWIVRPNVLEGFECLASHSMTYDFTNRTDHQLRHVLTIAERVPHLRIVIDHLGKPQAISGIKEPWTGIMTEAAMFPNIYVKLSGFANVLTTPVSLATKDETAPYVEHVIERFGADRIIMASNWPPSNLAADYHTTWRHTKELVSHLSRQDQARIQGDNAVEFYGLHP